MAGRIRANLAGIGARIAAAAERAGRSPESVQLLVVTKMVGPEETAALLDCGFTTIGENRVQDALTKAEALGESAGRFQWHLLGHLQSNKVRKALGLFGAMHSLDSARLTEALEKELAKPPMNADERRSASLAANQEPGTRNQEPPFPVYVEVNASGDASKTGASEAEVRAIFEKLKSCPHLAAARSRADRRPRGPASGGCGSCSRRSAPRASRRKVAPACRWA
jgi:uncharacterized pyridoxal phosphate-containing UPF0001 family protein